MTTQQKATHTAGQWKIRDNEIVDKRNFLICNIERHYQGNLNEDLSNARLIAAAPELLQACELALKHLRIEEREQEIQDVLVKAISKAKGESL